MAESTLTLTYWDLIEAVGHFLGVTSAPEGEELARARRYIESGYRRFLTPPPLTPQDLAKGLTHRWSFLSPTTTLALVADDYDYDLPDNFGSLVGEFHFASGVLDQRIEHCNEGKIMALRAANDLSSDALYCAIRPKAFAPTTGQRWEVIFYPTPASVKTLHYRYNVQMDKWGTHIATGTGTVGADPFTGLQHVGATWQADGVVAGDKVILTDVTDAISKVYTIASVTDEENLVLTAGADAAESLTYHIFDDALYHLGGMPHSECVKELCLAVAEENSDDLAGLHNAKAMRLLAASFAFDLDHAPKTLGYNNDRSDESETPWEYQNRRGEVTYS